ncbi:MAG: DnaJ domain-containing protein [Pseudomonadaceae bacterium]|nr:DnaJ domain-containing protein [Pseudomonadaceae bacterium]
MQSHLLFNQWFGKAVGATCAVIWAPADPLWLSVAIICGIALGHLYDHWAQLHHDDDHATLTRMGQRHQTSRSPHLEYLFAGLGRIAKAGGRVQPEHIAYAEQVMKQMGLTDTVRHQAKAWFSDGKKSNFPLQALSRECLQPTEQGSASRQSMLRCFCTLVAIAPSDAALSQLKLLGGYLGFAPNRVAREYGDIANRYRSQSTKKDKVASDTQHQAADPALQAAYALLQIDKTASFDQVKHAYRQQVSRSHPDKLAADASTAEKQTAQDKMVALRNALELIKTHSA